MTHPDLIAAAELLAQGAFNDELEVVDAATLSDYLYAWYINATPLPARTGPILPYELGLPAVLRAIHHEASRFEGGWRADTVSTWGRVLAKKDELSRMLERSEYIAPARRGLRAQPGDALFVTRCWDWIDEETGYWYLRRGEWPPTDSNRLVRLYWNCAPINTAKVLKAITSLLAADHGIPYVFKTPAQIDHIGRADALVLYLDAKDYPALEGPLLEAAQSVTQFLRKEIPRMTYGIAPGVGMAHGHVDGASFGESRCQLLAKAYLATDNAVRQSTPKLVNVLEDAFAVAGLDPARPYLEPSL